MTKPREENSTVCRLYVVHCRPTSSGYWPGKRSSRRESDSGRGHLNFSTPNTKQRDRHKSEFLFQYLCPGCCLFPCSVYLTLFTAWPHSAFGARAWNSAVWKETINRVIGKESNLKWSLSRNSKKTLPYPQCHTSHAFFHTLWKRFDPMQLNRQQIEVSEGRKWI